jgi:hypothetical protein
LVLLKASSPSLRAVEVSPDAGDSVCASEHEEDLCSWSVEKVHQATVMSGSYIKLQVIEKNG